MRPSDGGGRGRMKGVGITGREGCGRSSLSVSIDIQPRTSVSACAVARYSDVRGVMPTGDPSSDALARQCRSSSTHSSVSAALNSALLVTDPLKARYRLIALLAPSTLL